MLLRTITHDDWPSIMRIQTTCYSKTTTESLIVLKSKWQLSPNTCLVAEVEGQITGYCLAHPWHNQPPSLHQDISNDTMPTDTLYLHDMAILPSARGTGLATIILNELKHHALQLGLKSISLVAIQGAHTYWEKQGFKPENTTKCLKSYSSTPYYMSLKL